MPLEAKVPNRAVDVDSRALPACSCFISIDYLFIPQKIYAGDGVLARLVHNMVTLPPPVKGVSRYGVKKEVYKEILLERMV